MSIQRNDLAAADRAASASRSWRHALGFTSRPRCVSLTEISVKLTHLGLDVNPKACLQDLLALAARSAAAKSFLWIDMEESRYVDATLELYRAVRAARPDVGVYLQAYLRRTPADLEGLLP